MGDISNLGIGPGTHKAEYEPMLNPHKIMLCNLYPSTVVAQDKTVLISFS